MVMIPTLGPICLHEHQSKSLIPILDAAFAGVHTRPGTTAIARLGRASRASTTWMAITG